MVKLLFNDEFENDLHPHMLEPILDLFANPATNPKDAQLIFSTHAIEVLNLLEKSQIMLVEKDEERISTTYRLDTVEGIRNDDNFYAKYMAGAYGAVPNLWASPEPKNILCFWSAKTMTKKPFLKYLKSQLVGRKADLEVKIKNGKGKGATHVIDWTIRQSK